MIEKGKAGGNESPAFLHPERSNERLVTIDDLINALNSIIEINNNVNVVSALFKLFKRAKAHDRIRGPEAGKKSLNYKAKSHSDLEIIHILQIMLDKNSSENNKMPLRAGFVFNAEIANQAFKKLFPDSNVTFHD